MRTSVSTFIAATVLIAVVTAPARAALIPFILDGNAGLGLLPGNENAPVVEASSGGIGPGGITFDTITKMMSIDVRWGSANGFTDLTGSATAMHIHLPTANPAPAGFSNNASPSVFLDGLAGYNPSATAGSFIGTAVLSAAQEAAVLGNQSYINVHTQAHGGGELRGHLVVVPEPAAGVILIIGAAVTFIRRRTHQ